MGSRCTETPCSGGKPDSSSINLRQIGYLDPETGKRYLFLTNLFRLSVKTIAEIYGARWQVELLFEWIKQHLRIKTFIGISKNAVMSQAYVAMIAYLLLSYLKFNTGSPLTLYEFAKRMFNETDLRCPLSRRVGKNAEEADVTVPVQLSFTWGTDHVVTSSPLTTTNIGRSLCKTLVAQGKWTGH